MNETINDTKQVHTVGLDKIQLDHDFNCRGYITHADVMDLAKDIRNRGLDQPITVMETPDGPRPYKIITGHRRYMAADLNAKEYGSAPEIDCFIRHPMSEMEQHDLNLTENIQRQDLTMGQEARALRFYFGKNYSDYEIAGRLGKSITWVATRRQLLEMPDNVLTLADRNFLTPKDVNDLYRLRGDKSLFEELVNLLEDHKLKEARRTVRSLYRKKETRETKKARSTTQIYAMMDILRYICAKIETKHTYEAGELFTPEGNSLMTRVLAWASGFVSTGEVYDDIEDFCRLSYVDCPDILKLLDDTVG